MTYERFHRAISADGTEIVGRVRGRGPALVLVHGAIGDGDIAWEGLLPHLADRFTCYMPSMRGRGLSSDDPDHSPPRMEEDVTAFVDSIGMPVYLFGWSGGGPWVLGAAERARSLSAVATYEPALASLMSDRDRARTSATMEQVGMAAAGGRLVDAVRTFARWICTDSEIAALDKTNFYERWAGGIPAMLRFLERDASYVGALATDPDALGRLNAPVLLLRGQHVDRLLQACERIRPRQPVAAARRVALHIPTVASVVQRHNLRDQHVALSVRDDAAVQRAVISTTYFRDLERRRPADAGGPAGRVVREGRHVPRWSADGEPDRRPDR